MSISKIFIPNSLCVFSQIKDRKHVEQNFHSVARVMPWGWICGCWGESKTLAWGFAMAPHRLRVLVVTCDSVNFLLGNHMMCFNKVFFSNIIFSVKVLM